MIRVRLTVYHVIRVRPNCVPRDTCPPNCVPRDTCPPNCVSPGTCQANCVVQTVGGANGADDRRAVPKTMQPCNLYTGLVRRIRRLLRIAPSCATLLQLSVRRAASCAPTHLAVRCRSVQSANSPAAHQPVSLLPCCCCCRLRPIAILSAAPLSIRCFCCTRPAQYPASRFSRLLHSK